MAYSQMDPYQSFNSVPTAGTVAGTFAKAATNPLNYVAFMPNLIDINRGFGLPVISKYNLTPKNIAKSWNTYMSNGKLRKYPFKSISRFRKSLKRNEEYRWLGTQFSTYKQAKEIYRHQMNLVDVYEQSIEHDVMMLKRGKFTIGVNKGTYKRRILENKEAKEKILGSFDDPKFLKTFFKGDTAKIRTIDKLAKKNIAISRTYLGTTGLLRNGARLLKWGSRLSIATAIIGLGLMVGEPVGRSIVSGFNNAMGQFNNRFMPEMTTAGLQEGFLTQGAATERQRAIDALSKSSLNGRSAFGQEAMYFHM